MFSYLRYLPMKQIWTKSAVFYYPNIYFVPSIKTWPGSWCGSEVVMPDMKFNYYLNEGQLLDQQVCFYFFFTAILHHGLRNDFFLVSPIYFFKFLFGLLFSLFYLEFYFFLCPFFLFLTFISIFAQFAIWTWISSKFFFSFLRQKKKKNLEEIQNVTAIELKRVETS